MKKQNKEERIKMLERNKNQINSREVKKFNGD